MAADKSEVLYNDGLWRRRKRFQINIRFGLIRESVIIYHTRIFKWPESWAWIQESLVASQTPSKSRGNHPYLYLSKSYTWRISKKATRIMCDPLSRWWVTTAGKEKSAGREAKRNPTNPEKSQIHHRVCSPIRGALGNVYTHACSECGDFALVLFHE